MVDYTAVFLIGDCGSANVGRPKARWSFALLSVTGNNWMRGPEDRARYCAMVRLMSSTGQL